MFVRAHAHMEGGYHVKPPEEAEAVNNFQVWVCTWQGKTTCIRHSLFVSINDTRCANTKDNKPKKQPSSQTQVDEPSS